MNLLDGIKRLLTCSRCHKIQIVNHRGKFGEWRCRCSGCGLSLDCVCRFSQRYEVDQELLKPWRQL